MDSSGSVEIPMAGCCEDGDEPFGSIKCGAFLASCGTVNFSRILCSVELVC
jgi:hypothetical protein